MPLNLDISIVANRGLSQNDRMAHVDPDETACYESSYLHCLQKYQYWLVGMKELSLH